jgi:hypothetical protein
VPIAKRDAVWATIFLLGWLVPLAWVGVTNLSVPFLPRYLDYQYRIGALFPKYTPVWEQLYLQVRLEGEADWIDLPERQYFPALPFGYISRLNFLLIKHGRSFFPEHAGSDPFVAPRFALSGWLARSSTPTSRRWNPCATCSRDTTWACT